MTKTPKQILQCARKKIEKGWCQHAYAKAEDGSITSSRNERAVSWCAVGALMAESSSTAEYGDAYCTLLNVNEMKSGITTFNDAPGRTQAEVLAAFDKAIASLPD